MAARRLNLPDNLEPTKGEAEYILKNFMTATTLFALLQPLPLVKYSRIYAQLSYTV